MPSIDSALHHLLGTSSSVDKYSPSLLLSQRIDFVEPTRKDCYMEHLRIKYSPINRIEKPGPVQQKCAGELYSKEKVDLKWRQKRSIGCGLVNPANTCYLNSTLQCLLYTPPLINYLLIDHKKHCRSGGFCVSCGLLQLYNAVHSSTGSPCRPSSFIHHLKLIAKHFCYGRQEDAHEFLVHLRDKMIQQFLNSLPRVDSSKKDTTPAHAVFGGKLVSTVTCSQCSYQSHTNECFLGLGLDVRHSETIQHSFNKLCKKETLSGANTYKCEKCKRSVIATKQFSIDEAPNVLVLHLKRFQFGGFIGKLKNQIRFPEHLDIANWTRNKSCGTRYSLYAVLVHAGSSAQCGHYYCFVKSHNGSWHCMNDTSVNTCSLQRVLQSEAYLLFYCRNEGNEPSGSQVQASNGHASYPATNGTSTANGHKEEPKVRLMETNPFFPDSSKPAPQKPIKFGSLFSKSKLTKNPYLQSRNSANATPASPKQTKFIGPLLPNGLESTKSNGKSPSEPDAPAKSPPSKSDAVSSGEAAGPIISCTSSLSSLDIIKNTYLDDSDPEESRVYKPNAQPILSVRKKKSSEKPSVFDRLKPGTTSEKPKSVGNVFERLGQKAPVKSWNGKDSKNFSGNGSSWQSIGNPYKRERDDYDEELDQGRTKKVKHNKPHQIHQNRERHSFQKAHDFQKNQNRWEDRRSWNGNNSGKSPNHFWKNKKHKI